MPSASSTTRLCRTTNSRPLVPDYVRRVEANLREQMFMVRWSKREENRRFYDFRRIRRRKPPSRKFRLNPGLSVETGQFAANTGSATTVVTTGFQGKAVIFWGNKRTANGETAQTGGFSIGFSDGTNHRAIAWAGDHNVSTTNVGKSLRTASALDILTDGTPTSARRITGVAFNATDMTLTWDGTPAAAYLIGYMLLGGADITNVLVGHDVVPNATGTWNVDNNGSSMGFTGNFAMMLYNRQPGDQTATRATGSIGFAVSSAKEFTMAWNVDDGQTMSATVDAVSYTDANACIAQITDGAETIDFLANFLGFTGTGMDLNISNAGGIVNSIMPFLVIGGGRWDVGTTTLPDGAATTRTITGMTFQPQGLFIASARPTVDATVTVQANIAVGAATSTSTEATSGLHHADVINTSVIERSSASKIIQDHDGILTGVGIDFTNFTGDGYVITADGSFNFGNPQAGWFAMADNAATPKRFTMQVTRAGAFHGSLRSSRRTTYPPPVQERVQSRMIRKTTAARKREQAESSKWQTFAPAPAPPTVSIFRALIRKVFAGRKREPAPSHVLKQTFPPPVQENVLRRLLRRALAGRKREPGRGLVLKQTFPPPVRERIHSRLMRAVFQARKRAVAVSRLWRIAAPATENYFTRLLRRTFAPRSRAPAVSRLWRIGAPAAAPVGRLLTWRITRAGRRLREPWRVVSRWITNLPPLPPGPAPLLKRVAGWFRLFMRI